MKSLNFKRLSADAIKPTRAYGNSAGFDIYSSETVVLKPQEKHVLKSDIAVDIPDGYVGFLTSRSGVSSKTNLVIETGKIDAGYNGELGINIKNDSQSPDELGVLFTIKNKEVQSGDEFGRYKQRSYRINQGDKIAQLVIVPIVTPELNEVEEFETQSARGTNGFGSSDSH